MMQIRHSHYTPSRRRLQKSFELGKDRQILNCIEYRRLELAKLFFGYISIKLHLRFWYKILSHPSGMIGPIS
jgi:hypothetical protein